MTDALVKIDRLDHVHLYVLDRPAAIKWYARVLGLRLLGGWNQPDPAPDHPVFLAPEGSAHHCVSIFVGERPTGGDRTVAFHAGAQGFLAFCRALPVADILAVDGTPLRADSHHDYGMAITQNFLDPAGNHLELVTYDCETVRAGLAA